MEWTQKEKNYADLNHSRIFPSRSISPSNKEIIKVKEDATVSRYTSTQWITLLVLSLSNFCLGAISSVYGPIFPREAERHGVTPTTYGLIIGSVHPSLFVSSLIVAKLISYVSPKVLLNLGILTTGTACVLFGILDREPNRNIFVALAFVIRIVQGTGFAASKIASYSIIICQFKEKASTAIASLLTAVAAGNIAAEMLSGVLYDLSGFELPFFVMGGITLLQVGIIFFILPSSERSEDEEKADVLKFWLNPGVLVYAFAVFTCYQFYGFNTATLEPHLRQFNISETLVGMMFSLTSIVYALSAVMWGWLSDKKVGRKMLIFVACCFMIVSLLFIGPIPFFRSETRFEFVIFALLLMGLGKGGKLVCAFSGALEDTVARGFSPDINTYGLISSMFTSSQSIGAFSGSSLGGYLMENIGYRMSTFVLLCFEIVLMIILPIYACANNTSKYSLTEDEAAPIVKKNSQSQIRYL